MIRTKIARASGLAIGAAMALGFASQAGAVTIADLQAQIAALMAQLQSLQGGSVSNGAAITSDLTVGSSGAQVTALQNALIAQGYLHVSATGYFGSLTKAAVMAWQSAAGLPSTGFFGPLSRARFNGSVTGGTTVGGTTTGGTTVGGVTGSITTPGAEGTLSITAAPVSNSTVYEGDQNDAVLAFNAKATGSDLAIQRVKLNLGTATTLYNKGLSRVSLVDDQGRVLAQSDTNSTTVIKDGTTYYLTLSGFSSIVPKGTQRTYTIKVGVRDNAVADGVTSGTILLADNGVRAVDGAGIDLYGPSTGSTVTKTFTVSASLTDSASLTVSADSANPRGAEVVASNGASNNELDKLALLTFDIAADKDDVTITDLTASVTGTAPSTGATASSTYLIAGAGTTGQVLASASLSGSTATFSNMSYTIPKGTTRSFTIAADIRSARTTQDTFTASVTGNSTNIVATNSAGDTVTTVTGSATGNNQLVRSVGPVFALVGGSPVATRIAPAGFSGATSSAAVHFVVRMTAVGTAVEFGDTSSTTFAFIDGDNTIGGGQSINPLLGGSAATPAVSSSTALTIDTSKVASGGSNSYILAKGNSIDIPVDYVMYTKTSAGADVTSGVYQFQVARINWLTSVTGRQASTFMATDTLWRSNGVSLP
ncbi:peptidoglycan-binding protein [Candidatus Parcubacteria bacterium]|nr:peptidoglycan-binding protein [Candidatus Parcubacteria bacterium]